MADPNREAGVFTCECEIFVVNSGVDGGTLPLDSPTTTRGRGRGVRGNAPP